MPPPKPLPLDSCRHIVLLTGAGVSVSSGLPTYRGPGGLWEREDVAWIVDARFLPGSLPELWRLYSQRRAHALGAAPNAAHTAIAAVQRARPEAVTLLTQNVDSLHQRAGSPAVIELHGSAFRTRCTNPACGLPPFPDDRLYESVPLCPRCGSPLRPDVVLFGETLPEAALRRAQTALSECDLFLAVGTSGTVWPAAAFVRLAAQAGARTVLVNLDAATGSEEFDEVHLGKAEDILPGILSL
jgi:NAD-dependent deacetylase